MRFVDQLKTTLRRFIWTILDRVPDEYRPGLRRVVGSSRTVVRSALRGQPAYRASRVVWLRPEVADLEPMLTSAPSANEILVEVDASLVSPGTERAFLLGLPNTSQSFPSGAGYAAAGKVLRVGRSVPDWGPGDRFAGVAPHASHAIVRPDQIARVPDEVPERDAAFAQLGAIAMHGVRRAGIRPGEKVAVIGLGLIGQLSIQIARWAGGAPIVGMARSQAFFAQAMASGCDHVVSLDDDPDAPDATSADVVIEATGSPAAIPTAITAARDGGRVIIVGSPRGVTHGVDLGATVAGRGITVVGAHVSGASRREPSAGVWSRREESELFLDLVAAGRIELEHLISETESPAEANRVYERLVSSSDTPMGIVFDWTRVRQHEGTR